jgi:hypothetical protein
MAIACFAGKTADAWKRAGALRHKNVPLDENDNNDVASGSRAGRTAPGAGTRWPDGAPGPRFIAHIRQPMRRSAH